MMAMVYGVTALYGHSNSYVHVDHHGGYTHDDGGWDDGHHDYHVSEGQIHRPNFHNGIFQILIGLLFECLRIGMYHFKNISYMY